MLKRRERRDAPVVDEVKGVFGVAVAAEDWFYDASPFCLHHLPLGANVAFKIGLSAWWCGDG